MTVNATDWDEVALAKLQRVMGPSTGPELARAVLGEIGLDHLSTAKDLKRFADALAVRGGFASAVGALLSLHATMYDPAGASTPASRTGA